MATFILATLALGLNVLVGLAKWSDHRRSAICCIALAAGLLPLTIALAIPVFA